MAGTHLASGAGLAPDDFLLDLRDISAQEIYILVWQAPQRAMKSEERGIHERLASGGRGGPPPLRGPAPSLVTNLEIAHALAHRAGQLLKSEASALIRDAATAVSPPEWL